MAMEGKSGDGVEEWRWKARVVMEKKSADGGVRGWVPSGMRWVGGSAGPGNKKEGD